MKLHGGNLFSVVATLLWLWDGLDHRACVCSRNGYEIVAITELVEQLFVPGSVTLVFRFMVRFIRRPDIVFDHRRR
jgi:hypothetical protein